MKSENYYVINGWMRNELKLKGNHLLVYAIIYGFSQVPGTKYTGSLRYLSEASGVPRRTLIRVLNDLVRDGLIVKEPRDINGVTINDYYAVIPCDDAEKHDHQSSICSEDCDSESLAEMFEKIKNI